MPDGEQYVQFLFFFIDLILLITIFINIVSVWQTVSMKLNQHHHHLNFQSLICKGGFNAVSPFISKCFQFRYTSFLYFILFYSILFYFISFLFLILFYFNFLFIFFYFYLFQFISYSIIFLSFYS